MQTFDSNPRLGPLQFNTQYAEEAFTVYDHPKVLIFRKTDEYDSARVREILGEVDLSKVIDLTPKTASAYKGNLTLPPEMLAVQQAGGTWSDYFSYENPLNKYPILGIHHLVFGSDDPGLDRLPDGADRFRRFTR